MESEWKCSSLFKLLLGDYFPQAKAPTGFLKVEHVLGKSTATHVSADYPLRLMVPKKAFSSDIDSVLVYALTYGGGIVSGDVISCEMVVCSGTSLLLTTQGCTNIFKSVKGKTSIQTLKASVGSGAILAVLPDSLVCFADSKYVQVQAFDLSVDANIVLVDWMTSGRLARGEVWDFDSFKSINHIYIQGNTPLLLDSMHLERGLGTPFRERMDDFNVIGLIVIYGPRLVAIYEGIRKHVQSLTDQALNRRTSSKKLPPGLGPVRPSSTSPQSFFASCSTLGASEAGLVVRFASRDTKTVYQFLRDLLCPLQSLVGVVPYAGR